MNGTHPKRVAIYARVSSSAQDTELSLGAQLRALRDYAHQHGYIVEREFVDEAESGRSADRPAFRDMVSLAKVKAPPFQAILVWKLNRFARSRMDSITYKTLLRSKGIEVISINEPVDDSPTGRLIEGVIESIDEFYSANPGQDIKRGMRENASRGYFNGSRPPFGLRRVTVHEGGRLRQHLEPEPDGTPVVELVRRMFGMAASGMGCKAIAERLNVEGARTGTGQRWGATTVYKVLTNEAYKGTLVWGGRAGYPAARSGTPPVRVENAWPALVDPDLFGTVQERMAARGPKIVHPRTVNSRYLLTGFCFCACGRAMTGQSAKSGRHFYYGCSRAVKQGRAGCDARRLPKDKLEHFVIGKIRERVLTKQNLLVLVELVNEELEATGNESRDRLATIDAEIREVDGRLTRLYEVLETRALVLDDVAPRIKDLRLQLDALRKTRLQSEADAVLQGVQQVDAMTVRRHAEELTQLLDEAEVSERKTFLRSFVKRVEVEAGQITLHYTLPLPTSSGKLRKAEVLPIVITGGPEEIRTPDLPDANRALYH